MASTLNREAYFGCIIGLKSIMLKSVIINMLNQGK